MVKRKDIRLTQQQYQQALRKATDLLLAQNKERVEVGLVDRSAANEEWAALANLQDLLILMRRASVSVAELTEWVKDAKNVRLGLGQKPAANQTKLF